MYSSIIFAHAHYVCILISLKSLKTEPKLKPIDKTMAMQKERLCVEAPEAWDFLNKENSLLDQT